MGKTRRRGKIIKGTVHKRGHISLSLCRDGVQIQRTVHQLMCESFFGPRPEGYVARHLNDMPADNRIENLKWGTVSENCQDRVKNGHDYNAKKTVCERGHEYVEANLKYMKKSGRCCLSCHRAASLSWYYRTTKGIELDMQKESDRYYRKIVGNNA